MILNKDLVDFLSSTSEDFTLIDRLKIRYRPLVCPLVDLLQQVSQNNSVLDIGCGSGQFALLLAHFVNPKKVMGIEISQRLIDNAYKISSNFTFGTKLDFTYFDGVSIPDVICEYDTICMIDVYHHIPVETREDFMSQVVQKMSKGSRLIFKDIDASSGLVYFNKLHDLIFAGEIGREVSSGLMRLQLERLGLKMTEQRKQRTFLYPHFTQVYEK